MTVTRVRSTRIPHDVLNCGSCVHSTRYIVNSLNANESVSSFPHITQQQKKPLKYHGINISEFVLKIILKYNVYTVRTVYFNIMMREF